MPQLIRSISALGAAGILLFAGAGCSRNATEARAVARGNRYFEAGKYDAAEIEYFNALRLDGENAEAITHLAIIYSDQGRVGESYPFLNKARLVDPDNLEVRLKYGLFLLAYGEFQKAQVEANYILDHKPEHKDAPLLLAESATPKDIAAARQRLGRLPAPIQASAPVLVALGILDFRQNQMPEAEDLFKKALTADPKSSAAYTALASLYWEKKDLPDAEIAFARAADLSAERSQKRIQYAQFKIQTGDREAGRKMLEDIIHKTPDFLPAAMLLASLDEAEKKFDDGMAAVANVLSRDPSYPDALLLSGRLLLEKGETKRAVAELERAQHFYPNYPQIAYELAQAYLADGSAEKATNSLMFAVAKAPDYAEAVMSLAQVNMQKGDLASATLTLRQLIQRRPDFLPARVVLGRTYVAENDPDDALDVFQQLAAVSPKDPEPLFLSGLVYLGQGNHAEARRALEKSLTLTPDYFPALEQLVNLDVVEKKYADARQLIDTQVAKNPKNSDLLILLSKLLIVHGDSAQAEANLRQAIQLQPNSAKAYFVLAELYITTHQENKALADLQQDVAKDPKDLAAWMLMGGIDSQINDYAGARTAYEKVLAINANFSSALNDLAYIYSEHFGELDKALEMAQKARKLLPTEPRVADTLGWILFRKHQYEWALSFLQEAANGLPEDPETQYHLGITQYMMGQIELAQIALERAVEAKQGFPGLDDARQRLAVLAVDVRTAGPAERTVLEKAAVAQPDDPVILPRLAAVYERSGDFEKAIGVCEQALKKNPNDLAALTQLVRLYDTRGETTKAFEAAKAARKLAPSDADVAYATGRLAYRMHDYPWSLSLLRESATQHPTDPELLFDLAQSAYSEGNVSDAESAAQSALQSNPRFSRAAEAKQFLQLIQIADHPELTPSENVDVDRILSSEPNNIQALMAVGKIDQQEGKFPAAKQAFENVLKQYPDFFPANRPLVLIYAASPGDSQKAFDVATKAREAYPNDSDVARACGIIDYRDGDYERTETLLKESSNQRPADGELMFYLGMAQYHLKEATASKVSLQKALELNVGSDLAAEARKTLATIK